MTKQIKTEKVSPFDHPILTKRRDAQLDVICVLYTKFHIFRAFCFLVTARTCIHAFVYMDKMTKFGDMGLELLKTDISAQI